MALFKSYYIIILLLFFNSLSFAIELESEASTAFVFKNDSTPTNDNDTIIFDRSIRSRRSYSDTIPVDTIEHDSPTYILDPTDTISSDIPDIPDIYIEEDIEKESIKTASKHSPTKAAMLSATLPGLGQVYNRKYWKVPVLYAGLGAVVYFVNLNNTEYQKWREAYIYRVDGNPNTVDGFPNHSTDILNRAMNYYRRNLEISYIAGALVYLLGILDASVDAHLMDFDVSGDLSINIKPVFLPVNINTGDSRVNAGLTLGFKF